MNPPLRAWWATTNVKMRLMQEANATVATYVIVGPTTTLEREVQARRLAAGTQGAGRIRRAR